MPKFVTKNIKSVCGRQEFKQLVIVENSVDVAELQRKIDCGEEDIEGVLDIYEKSLESAYKSSFRGIIARMNLVAQGESVPTTKFHPLGTSKNGVQEYEFKQGDLRVYAIKIRNGKLIILCGFKNNQDKDISRFRSLKDQYLSMNV